ncbi:MAG TPA: thioredoxin family protein [Flavobacterium sp.]|nr:thioredoxin family protein [Flavobacterium sp.]
MKEIIKKSLEKSFSYTEYRNHVSNKLAQGEVTGNEQSEHLLKYSELNVVRMNRLDKTLTVHEDVSEKISSIKSKLIWLVLSEGWCGDAAQLLPVINKKAELSENIKLKVLLRDENEELMNQFLTNGGKAIPKLIIIEEETLEVLDHWGPRPEGASKLISDYKATHGIVDEIAKTELQKWYLQDKGFSTQKEIIEKLEEIEKQLV